MGMLLVIDVGNTNTVLGLFDEDSLQHDWRIRTEIDHTIDEYGVLIYNLYQSIRMKSMAPGLDFWPMNLNPANSGHWSNTSCTSCFWTRSPRIVNSP